MKVLILGGTGAMGKPLVEELSHELNVEVYVTSRVSHNNKRNIHYLKGNAHELSFLRSILKNEYDTVVDFMSYKVTEFKEKIDIFLKYTGQYIFLSSGRVYANTKEALTEKSPRLLDISNDKEYLSSNEYSLEKAREENLLQNSGKNNWTIIRPYITYSDERLQLGIYEKELWLERAIEGKIVVIPKSILNCKTTLTCGRDVSTRIAALIGNSESLGKVFNITSDRCTTWKKVINLYSDELFYLTGKYPRFIYSDYSNEIADVMGAEYQLKYDRLFCRVFDNTRIRKFSQGKDNYILWEDGLRKSLDTFIKQNGKFNSVQWPINAYMDKITVEKSSLKYMTFTEKIKYLIARYTPYFKVKRGYKCNKLV